MARHLISLVLLFGFGLAGCDRAGHIGKPPDLTPTRQGSEEIAMLAPGLPMESVNRAPVQEASLWSGAATSSRW